MCVGYKCICMCEIRCACVRLGVYVCVCMLGCVCVYRCEGVSMFVCV